MKSTKQLRNLELDMNNKGIIYTPLSYRVQSPMASVAHIVMQCAQNFKSSTTPIKVLKNIQISQKYGYYISCFFLYSKNPENQNLQN